MKKHLGWPTGRQAARQVAAADQAETEAEAHAKMKGLKGTLHAMLPTANEEH